MSGQIFAGDSPGLSSGRTTLLPKWVPRIPRFAADLRFAVGLKSCSKSDPAAKRPESEAMSVSSAPHRLRVELGILLHLVCVGAVGIAIIAVSIGVGLYSLGRWSEELISGSSPLEHAGVAPARLANKAPATDPNLPPLSAASLGVLAASPPDSPQPAPAGIPGGQAPQLSASAKPPGAPSEPRSEPAQAQGSAFADSRRQKNASADIVTGPITEAADAMTWVVGDQIVRLWGIRPGPRNLRPPLDRIADSVRAKGPVKCHKQPYSSRYQCFTAAREDLAEAALLAGAGRAAGGASPAYRDAEAQAHRQAKGIWAKL